MPPNKPLQPTAFGGGATHCKNAESNPVASHPKRSTNRGIMKPSRVFQASTTSESAGPAKQNSSSSSFRSISMCQ
jgi:hypothetical protein